METEWWIFAAVAIGAYLWGSVSYAVLVSRANGVNIMEAGSKNPGATNVKRVVGKRAGNLVFVLDFFKGLIGSGLPVWFNWGANPNETAWLGVIAMLATVLGHCVSVFLKFKGGKGVASTAGGIAGLMPLVLLCAIPIWMVVFYLSRMVSLPSILMVLSFPLWIWLFNEANPYLYLSLALIVLILVRHRTNIARICRGEENRFDKKK